MDWNVFLLATVAALLVGLYAILARGLLILTDPFRRRAYKLARDIVTRDDIPKSLRENVERAGLHDNALGAWGLALLVTPVSIAALFDRNGEVERFAKSPSHGAKIFFEYNTNSIIGCLGNSPLAFVLFSLQITLILGATGSTILLSRLSIGNISSVGDRFPVAHRH